LQLQPERQQQPGRQGRPGEGEPPPAPRPPVGRLGEQPRDIDRHPRDRHGVQRLTDLGQPGGFALTDGAVGEVPGEGVGLVGRQVAVGEQGQ
jgi:hypothetical protein